MVIHRTLYLVGLVSWVAYVILFPNWIGRSYHQEMNRPETIRSGGVFGLQGGDGLQMNAPLWDPPKPHSDAIDAAVRWPWQPVRESAHVELDLASIAMRLSLGVIVFGLLLRAGVWLFARGQSDSLVVLAWCLSLSLIIAWICILAIGAFTFGYGLSDGVVIAIFAFGLVGGCGYAAWALKYRSSVSTTAHGILGETALQTTLAGVSSPEVRVLGTEPRNATSALLWLTIGIVSALCLAVVGGWIASFFRGPVVGVWELGTPRYAKDQSAVNVVTGLGVLAAGWAIGLIAFCVSARRAFALGLIVGTTLLGIAFAFWD